MRPLILNLCVLSCIAMQAFASDARFVEVRKLVVHRQTAPAAPPVQDATEFQFRARIDLTRTGSVSSASVKWPGVGGATRALTNYLTYVEFSQTFPNLSAMNLTHPNGTYTFNLQTGGDGKKTNVLTLAADLYPNLAHVANFAAAQQVDWTSDFKLQWDPLIASDLVQVRIFQGNQVILDTGGVPGAAGILPATATSLVIPRNTFQEGAVYTGEVTVTRRSSIDLTGYPNVPAWASFSRRTEFPIRTIFQVTDVQWYGLAKVQRFVQTSPLPPIASSTGGYQFMAFGFANDPASIKAASVQAGSSAPKTFSASGGGWGWSDAFGTQQSLESSYPAGPYLLSLQTAHNGSMQIGFVLTAPNFPAAPQISNWNDASAIDASKAFLLKWNPLSGGTTDDMIKCSIRKNGQVVFRTGDYPQASGALNGTLSSLSIPAGLLQPGESAEASIVYLKANSLDPFSYPRSLGFAGWGAETVATIRARGGSSTAPLLGNAAVKNGALEFNISAETGRQYIIQSSADLRSWADLFVTNSPGTAFQFRTPLKQPGAAFLRALAN